MSSDLAREIAQLRGWTWRTDLYGPLEDTCTGWEHAETGTWWHDSDLPQPDTDPAAAFELLEYVAASPFIHVVSIRSGKLTQFHYCSVNHAMSRAAIERQASTLAVAIALACRDALRAIRGQGAGQ